MTNEIRKLWNSYPEEFRNALLKAHQEGYTLRFKYSHEAKSWQVRMQYMSARIRRDHEAPKELMEAANSVIWAQPAMDFTCEEDTFWAVTGTARTGLTDAELAAQMKEAAQ